jgi:hypothetical protein
MYAQAGFLRLILEFFTGVYKKIFLGQESEYLKKNTEKKIFIPVFFYQPPEILS